MIRALLLAFAATCSGFSIVPAHLRGGAARTSSPKMAEIGESGVAFETVAREWRW